MRWKNQRFVHKKNKIVSMEFLNFGVKCILYLGIGWVYALPINAFYNAYYGLCGGDHIVAKNAVKMCGFYENHVASFSNLTFVLCFRAFLTSLFICVYLARSGYRSNVQNVVFTLCSMLQAICYYYLQHKYEKIKGNTLHSFLVDLHDKYSLFEHLVVVLFLVMVGITLFGKSQPWSLEYKDSTRERLVKFYQKYNVDKLDQVDKMLRQYAGAEDLMFLRLEKKYCNEHSAGAASGDDVSVGGDSGDDASGDDSGDEEMNTTPTKLNSKSLQEARSAASKALSSRVEDRIQKLKKKNV